MLPRDGGMRRSGGRAIIRTFVFRRRQAVRQLIDTTHVHGPPPDHDDAAWNAGYSPLQFWTALALRRAFPGPSVKLNGAIGYRRRRRRRQLECSGKKRAAILTGKMDGAWGTWLPLSIVVECRGKSVGWMPG